MSSKTNKLTSQEGKKDYGEEAAEENAFNRARTEESASGARLQREMNMAGYATRTANDYEEEEEEENAEGNCNKP